MNYHQGRSRINHQIQPARLSQPQLINNSRVMVSANRLQNINMIEAPTNELGGLFLGDIISIMKEDIMKNNKIQAVLSCMYENVSMQHFVHSHKILSIKDTLDYPIINHLDEAIAWIHQHRKDKYNVLVHCHAGVSRSATIVIAYLIRTKNMNPGQALDYVRSKRERAKPNFNFWNQINEYYNFWLNASQNAQKKPSRIDNVRDNSATRHSSHSMPHKMIESRLVSKPPQIKKSQQTEKVNQNNSHFNQRRSIHNAIENQKVILVDSQRVIDNSRLIEQAKKQINAIETVKNVEIDQQKGLLEKKALNKRKRIFDNKYTASKPLKTQQPLPIQQPRLSIKLQYQRPDQAPIRHSAQLNSQQNHLFVSSYHPSMQSSMIVPAQMYNSHYFLQPQPRSVIIQKPDNRSKDNFPYNIKFTQNVQHSSTYQLRQQSNNVLSPFAARNYYP